MDAFFKEVAAIKVLMCKHLAVYTLMHFANLPGHWGMPTCLPKLRQLWFHVVGLLLTRLILITQGASAAGPICHNQRGTRQAAVGARENKNNNKIGRRNGNQRDNAGALSFAKESLIILNLHRKAS